MRGHQCMMVLKYEKIGGSLSALFMRMTLVLIGEG